MGKYEKPAHSHKNMARAVGVIVAIVLLAVVGVVGYELFAPFFAATDAPEPSSAPGTLPAETGESLPEPTATTAPAETEESLSEPTATTAPAETEPLVDPLEREARSILAGMTLHEKICQMFIVTQEQLTGSSGAVTESGEAAKAALEEYPVGGIVYFARNIVTPEQCTQMIQNIQSYSKLGLFIAVDEEGGLVARIGSNAAMGTTCFPSMATVGQEGTEAAYEVGSTIGREITAFGFNLDFAPVADVNSNPNNTVIGSRAFSTDAAEAAELVASAVRGFRDGGILCCLKHFPGHGDTAADSHFGAVFTDKTLEEMQKAEFLPFAAGIEAGAEFVMVGHISTPNVTEDGLPASLSYTMITEILREQLGFQGIVITDSMAMQAITDAYTAGEAAVLAIGAGVDILLMPGDLQSAVNGLEEAVSTGALTEERINESVLRILKVKLERGILDVQ